MQSQVFLGLGSNLQQPLQQLRAAVKAIGNIPSSQIVAVSSVYRSKPLGPQDQPDYLNAAVQLSSHLSALELLDHTQQIEQQQGRIRGRRWGERTLDIDILLFGEHTLCTERLTIPHYAMQQRDFVLTPLCEIAPDLHLPDGQSVASVYTQLTLTQPSNLIKLEQSLLHLPTSIEP